ncbi:9880_t:CDS:2, partial [Dentiscutata heterogama]
KSVWENYELSTLTTSGKVGGSTHGLMCSQPTNIMKIFARLRYRIGVEMDEIGISLLRQVFNVMDDAEIWIYFNSLAFFRVRVINKSEVDFGATLQILALSMTFNNKQMLCSFFLTLITNANWMHSIKSSILGNLLVSSNF